MTHCLRRLALVSAFALALPGAAFAQHSGAQHSGTRHAESGAASGQSSGQPSGPAVAEMRAASERMHKAMDIPYTGDPDRDFAAAMIPHHQGAIEMARIQLQHGKDPVLREMAQEIIDAQQKEIAVLRSYLNQGR
jgi:uncharacterized protein (DUF305 family)